MNESRPDDRAEAKAALEKARRDLEVQKSLWPSIRKVRQDLADALEENHFSERIRIALGGRNDRR